MRVIYQNKTLNTASGRPSGDTNNNSPKIKKVPAKRIAIETNNAPTSPSGLAASLAGRANGRCAAAVTPKNPTPAMANHKLLPGAPMLAAARCALLASATITAAAIKPQAETPGRSAAAVEDDVDEPGMKR